jgi:aminopeptidase-like protein
MSVGLSNKEIGLELHKWATDLFPITRSLTGPGVRETFSYLKKLIPELSILSVPSGKKVFDWTVPKEWIIREAYIADKNNAKIIDIKNNNLHVVGYSKSINKRMNLEELNPFLHSIPNLPHAIPYVTSFYNESWGFCISEKQRMQLKDGEYHVYIDSELIDGVLNYGELIIKGQTDKEILLSTYICHPSMANNELSGPVVTTAIARWLKTLEKRKYTYRIIFVPETIGSIVYINENFEKLKKATIAGYQITCIGDDRAYSFLPSRLGNTLSDKAAEHVLKHLAPGYKKYSFLDRGSDERQFCSPGVDLPIASVMRSKHGEYPEYHTSLDNLDFVTPSGLAGGFSILKNIIELIENNCKPVCLHICEPQLGKRGLYPNVSKLGSVNDSVKNMMNLIAYSDGNLSLLEIAEIIDVPMWELVQVFRVLKKHAILSNN